MKIQAKLKISDLLNDTIYLVNDKDTFRITFKDLTLGTEILSQFTGVHSKDDEVLVTLETDLDSKGKE